MVPWDSYQSIYAVHLDTKQIIINPINSLFNVWLLTKCATKLQKVWRGKVGRAGYRLILAVNYLN